MSVARRLALGLPKFARPSGPRRHRNEERPGTIRQPPCGEGHDMPTGRGCMPHIQRVTLLRVRRMGHRDPLKCRLPPSRPGVQAHDVDRSAFPDNPDEAPTRGHAVHRTLFSPGRAARLAPSNCRDGGRGRLLHGHRRSGGPHGHAADRARRSPPRRAVRDHRTHGCDVPEVALGGRTSRRATDAGRARSPRRFGRRPGRRRERVLRSSQRSSVRCTRD